MSGVSGGWNFENLFEILQTIETNISEIREKFVYWVQLAPFTIASSEYSCGHDEEDHKKLFYAFQQKEFDARIKQAEKALSDIKSLITTLRLSMFGKRDCAVDKEHLF